MEARSAGQIWEAALGELQIQVNKSNYQTWLAETAGLSFQDNQFVVGVPNTFAAAYLDQNQRSLIEKTLIGLTHRNLKVVFSVNGNSKNGPGSYSSEEEVPTTCAASPSRLNQKYSFDSFVVGNCNRLAYAAALAVAEKPGYSYNPLFIYGGVGLGKTHLLQAIGQAVLASSANVVYVTAEQFTNELTNAIRERKTNEFRSKYRSADMLLVDDIHFVGGKEQTEENLFHTFNELHNANRQIVFTSNHSPKSIPLLQDRLRSRFEWGLVTGIKVPDFKTRLAILRAKAEQQRTNIAADVLEFIAHQIKQNVRELEGSLNRVMAYAKLLRALVTPELAAEALDDIGSKAPESPTVTPDLVIEAVASSFQLSPVSLKGRRRDKETSLARGVAMYIIKEETNSPLTQIGKEIGDRDHSTVFHACDKIANEIDVSPYLSNKIASIRQVIHQNLQTGNR